MRVLRDLALTVSAFTVANALPNQIPISPIPQAVEYQVLKHEAFPDYQLRVHHVAKGTKAVCDNVEQIYGYFDVTGSRHLFFWLFESRSNPEADDFVYWTNGGPGSSSVSNGLLMELGPCRVNPGGKTTTPFEYSWNQKATVLFVDHPAGVGFSYSDNILTTPYSSMIAASDIYGLLQLLFVYFPKYAKLPFHATGESYAGHYIPAIGITIFNNNRDAKGPVNINLKSIAIGNGWTDPREQFVGYAEMACDGKYAPLVSDESCDSMYGSLTRCRQLMDLCYRFPGASSVTCLPANLYCERQLNGPYDATGRNPYDVRMVCGGDNDDPCYPQEKDIEFWLDLPSTQAYLGVNRSFVPGSETVAGLFSLSGDQGKPFVKEIQELLLNDISVLIYVGDADWICNAPSQVLWMRRAFVGFLDAKEIPWKSSITGRDAGFYKLVPKLKLAYVNIYESGHFVPTDQPEHGVEMLNEWLDMVKKTSQMSEFDGKFLGKVL
ncbi:hypothetical protein SmJEL517_g00492 [Synchytrium microbalum]|uniref:carboxypeptidase C n=1 Tax=Synchytrium microbalum TaxID=1806994 RepID=A0A507CDL6_9FUNG|nr:uncharacterized protein SmJEL517_g00492 [Synchytrium microbalum]TPX37601.1 hypothetical protein SmJEL517_g00492 [Synchytrium microbalum]